MECKICGREIRIRNSKVKLFLCPDCVKKLRQNNTLPKDKIDVPEGLFKEE